MQQFDFRRGGKKCSVTDRSLEPGEVYWSALVELPDGRTTRLDFSDESWEGPSEDCIGFWKQHVPDLKTGKVYWAPRNVLLAYFKHQIEQKNLETVFVMSLLLQQKKVLSLKDTIETDEGPVSILVDRRSSETFEVSEIEIKDELILSIQNELAEHLFSNQPVTDDEDQP